MARRDCAGGTPRSADECLAQCATVDVGSHGSALFLADDPTQVQAQARSDDDTARSASPGARLTRFHRANRWSRTDGGKAAPACAELRTGKARRRPMKAQVDTGVKTWKDLGGQR